MSENTVRHREFGADLGLLKEVVITGRKVGADEAFYASLAHNEELFRMTVDFVRAGGQIIQSIAAPAGLAAILERQASRLIEVGAAAAVKVAEGKYRDQLMAAVNAFLWREDLAAIGLNRLAAVDFRLPGQFLAEAGGITCGIAPDACTLYQGVAVPDRVLVIQGQWGIKYRNKKPRWCRNNFNPLEQGLTVKERLTVHLFEGEALLRECYTDLPGSVSPRGSVPCLSLWGGGPRLGDSSDDVANPGYGSGSRGK